MPLKDVKYKYNQTILKVYGYGDNKKIKVITMNCLRTSGIEDENEVRAVKGSVNDSKLEQNIIRTKNQIFELAFCNPWDYFFTATLDPKKYDRTNLDKFREDLKNCIKYYNKKYNLHIKYLLIPEKHADGKSYHMHGFLYGLSVSHLKQFKIGDKMGKSLAEKVKNGDVVYNWEHYQDKFGFCDLEPIRNPEAVSKYITKYINKNLYDSVTELNKRKFYSSLGLKKAVQIKKGTMLADIAPTYTNDYCSVAWLDYSEELLNELQQSFIDIDYYKTRK